MNLPITLQSTELELYVAECTRVTRQHIESEFPNNAKNYTHTTEVEVGPKWIRVVRVETSVQTGENCGRSAHSFINRESGDVLLTDGWKRASKHVRGNLSNLETLKPFIGPYALLRLR